MLYFLKTLFDLSISEKGVLKSMQFFFLDLSIYLMISNSFCIKYFKVVFLKAKGVTFEFLVATTETDFAWL